MKKIIVQKYGSSVLPDHQAFPKVVAEIKQHVDKGYRVIAIISALGNTTNRLQRELQDFNITGAHAVANYLAVGEIQAASLVTLSARQAGLQAELIMPQQIELQTLGDSLNANPIALNAEIIQQHFKAYEVLILPGFFGVNQRGQTTLLGRGGSDLSALFVARALQADLCQLYKDVDGVYDADPATLSTAKRYSVISWRDALQLPGRIVQHKTVELAAEHQLCFSVKALGKDYFTLVGGDTSILAIDEKRREKCVC